MKLEQWMSEVSVSDKVLAEMIGVDRSSVSRLRRGKHFPSPTTMVAISQVTAGLVMPNDFYEIAALDD
jgi:transcriptional regulator with XRE-family HTH domain